MPPKKPVLSLQEQCKYQTLYNICAVILDEIYFSEDEDWEIFDAPVLSVRLQTVRDILGNTLAPSILEDILNMILEKDEAVDTTVRYIALQLLLVEGVNTLTIGHFPEAYYSHVLEAVAESAAELKRLDLRGLWIGVEHKYYICRILRRLTSIKFLTLRYNCDDELLGIIGKYCPNMEKLDISGSLQITEMGFYNFYNGPRSQEISKTLRILDLGGDGKNRAPPEHVYKLLCNMPNIVSLGSYDKTGSVLDIAYKTNNESKFKLQYLHDSYTTSEKILAIIKTCPEIKAIYLDCPKGICVHHLHMLKDLSEIKLHKVSWDDIKAFLTKSGGKIKSLFFITVFGQVDLLELGRLCPSLVRLELHRCSLICSGVSHDIAFKRLKQAFIYTTEITTLCVKLILNQSVGIQHLSFGMCGQLTDAAVISCLMDHSLKQVEALWFGQADNLSTRALDALIEHCPLLNSLGNLAAWDLSQEDIEMKKIALHLNNDDLVLHDIGPENDDEREDIVFLI